MPRRTHDDPVQEEKVGRILHLDDDELEPEVLTYREFQRQVTLDAWQARRRAYESGDAENAGPSVARHLARLRHAVSRLGWDNRTMHLG